MISKGFTIKLNLPSGASARVPELTNRHYLSIIKYSENKDYEGVNTYLHELLNIDSSLDIIDRFYLMIAYRMIFVNESLIFKNDAQNTLEYDLNLVLQKLEAAYTNYDSIIEDKGVHITVGLPRSLYFNSIDDIYDSIIKSIILNNKHIIFSELSATEKETILSHLPQTVFVKMNSYIDRLSEMFEGIVIMDDNPQFNLDTLKVDIISNGMIAFIAAIYSHNIIDYMEVLYGYLTKICPNPELFYGLSPIDTKVMLNIHNREVERANEALQTESPGPN